jgi:hypothetical protein
MKDTAKAGVIMLQAPKLDVLQSLMSISGLMFNSHLDRTVSLTTLSSKVLTPSDQNSCLENILICMLIVETAENDRHLYYSSLRYCSMHIFILEPLHFWCRGVFLLYIGLFVRVTTGNRIPNMCCFPLKCRGQHLIFFFFCTL